MMKSQTRAEKRIDTVAGLRVGDEITIEGRAKPFVVTHVKARTVETYDGEKLTQHGAEIEGGWKNAATFSIVDSVNPLVGEHTGEIKFRGDVPQGVSRGFDVRRVGGEE